MFACVFVLCVAVSMSECVTVYRDWSEPATSYKEELSPLHISCSLTDIVIISTPNVRHNTHSLSYLYRPNGDVMQLNITPPIQEGQSEEEVNDFPKYIKNEDCLLSPKSSYRVENVNFGRKIDSKTKDAFRTKANEFVIGPLEEEDHGNWVLSLYFTADGKWVEHFQVISIEITEQVPTEPQLPELDQGATLTLGFAYPIKHLESCQLTIPKSSYDRYYELASSDFCRYIIRNVTEDDAGTWEIRAVGKIVYEGKTQLKVWNRVT